MGVDSDLGDSQPATSSSEPSHGEERIRKLHILPLKEAEPHMKGRSRMEVLGDTLRQLRSGKEVVRSGDLVKASDAAQFVIIKCDPAEGCLGMDTDFFVDGSPVICFQKIQFSAWGPTELSSEQLFNEYVRPYFKGEYAPYGPNAKRVRLLYMGQVVQVNEVYLQVEATEPQGLGMVSADTEIFASWDSTPEFEKVHILPFMDTLPRAYEYELFGDYLKPYLVANPCRKYQANEFFTYQGVQFKVVACEPDTVARIGKATTIFCEGQLQPSLRNLLPPNVMSQVAQLPQGLQMLLLSSERTTREVEEMMNSRRGLFPQTIEEIEQFSWPPAGHAAQSTCMVCLEDFQLGTACRRLPCSHVFHQSCIDEWLKRCTDCPICKANVDRAVRNY